MTPIAIYGFCFTKEIPFEGGVLTPRFTSAHELKTNNCDTTKYVLTGFFTPSPSIYSDITQTIFDLAAVLSFIEQKNVILGGSLEEDETPFNFRENLPLELTPRRNKGPGKIIIEDYFSSQSRNEFIQMAMRKLNENVHADQNPFRTAFFKSMFSFREKMDYADVKYFLNFSALESLCRYIQDDKRPSKTPQIITTTLQNYGFNVSKENDPTPQRNIMHYCKLRNSLFHNGEYIAYAKDSICSSIIKLSDYSSNLNLLLPLLLIKHIGFDDGLINWDSWYDHNPFISLRPHGNNINLQM